MILLSQDINNKPIAARPILVTGLTTLCVSLLTACGAQQMAEPTSTQPATETVSYDAQAATSSKALQKNGPMMMEAAPVIAGGAHSPALYLPPPQTPAPNSENYAEIDANPVKSTKKQAFATLSIDTDTGSYANVRRFLNDGSLPPADAVRVEELINYFSYDFSHAQKQANAPFLVSTEMVKAPWHPTNNIIKVGIKAEDPIASNKQQPPANLVFLVDVSGSMSAPNKLQLAKSSLKMLTKQLRAEDTITLITYAGNTEVVLPPTSGKDTQKIINAIENLNASGSTNGEAAIKLAYQQAEANFKKKGINRILMLTDGDFNVGVSSVDDMLDIIRNNRDKGISLSTLGFGQGNYNDHMMEQVADNGNGNYSYIDSLSEAKKVLIDEMSATFNTIAKDVKIQLEFNPAIISEWRLIGYENRVLAKEDFNNDKVDAGELGAGKSVVALFEVTPVGKKGLLDDSRYQKTAPLSKNTNEAGFLKIRYKAPNGDTSKLLSFPIANRVATASADTNFAMGVAGYGQLLSDSKYMNNFGYSDVQKLAKKGVHSAADTTGSRREFLGLIELADALD